MMVIQTGTNIQRSFFADRSPIPETSPSVHKITNVSEFDALLSSTTHVVVDFYADWCPPCRAIAPIFSKLANEHAAKGHLAFAKVNVDHVKDIGGRYSITAMPTFVFLKDGKPHPVEAKGIKPAPSVQFTSDGLVDRLRGADPISLTAVVLALSNKDKPATAPSAPS